MDSKSGFTEQMPASIGRYQVQESIGYGAMGAVYKAFDPLIKRTLAIKTIRLDVPRNSPQYKSFIERFYHEARISGTLSHPNIVTLFDIGEEGGLPYLAMEYVEGETIASLLERGAKFQPEKVVSLISQVASAVDYAHSKGVIHRDIKPSNMILSEDRVKVTDFGIAKLVDAEMTQSGTLLGTPSYMSPEQAMGDKLDGRSDIFSLGVCAFEMLSGEQPFPGANVTSILYKLVHVEPIEPANLEMNGLVPQKWHEVFGKVLAKKPDERYQSAAEFVADLEFCLGSWFGGVGAETLVDTTGSQAVGAAARDAASAQPPKPSAQTPPATADEGATKVMTADQLRASRGATQKGAPAGPQPALRAKSAEEPATVVIGAQDTPTLAMPGPNVATARMPSAASGGAARPPEVTLRVPAPLPTLKAPVPDDAVTARVELPPTTRGPKPPPAVPPPVTATLRSTPAPAPAAPAPVARKPGRPGLSPALILGGAALFFVLAVGLAGFLLWKRSVAEVVAPPTPEPVVEATPAPSPLPTPPLDIGSLRVETTPPGAAISVNGEERGSAPLDLTGLAVGNYEVRAELRGYEAKAETVTIVDSAPAVELKLALTRLAPATGSVEIVSQPPGAEVSIDGNRVGLTPLADLKLRAGSHRVEISADGYLPWSGSVSVEAGKKAELSAVLSEVPKATPPPSTLAAVDPQRVYLNTTSEVDVLARKTSGATASYPASGAPRLKSGEAVSVSVTFVVDQNGDVDDVKVIESAGAVIDESVVKAIRKWKYSPALKQGVKVKVKITFKQTFRAG
jgi:serine/threonine-protein kinase